MTSKKKPIATRDALATLWPADLLELSAFFLLIFVAALRPMVAEAFDSGGDLFAGIIAGIGDPAPARTIALDLVSLTAAALALTGVMLKRASFRHTGLGVGLLLMSIGACVSIYAAGNKRLALNASLDWLCMPIAAIALIQVTRRPWQVRLLLGAVLATAAVQAFQCFDQYESFADTWAHYQTVKEQLWAAKGVDLESGQVALFEQRMRANEAGGFFAHTNVAASYLVMCGITGLGLAASFHGRRGSGSRVHPLDAVPGCNAAPAASGTAWMVLAGGTSLFILSALYLTGSLGGWLSAALAALFAVMARTFRRTIATKPRAAFLAAWAVVIAGGMLLAGYGLCFDSLPGASLTFRLEYWKSSAGMIADHFWTGVGRENFGRHYLQYKPIHAPEEVANPHNLLVQAAAEWGIAGALGVIAMMIGGSIAGGRALADAFAESKPEGSAVEHWSPRTIFLGGLVLLVALAFTRAALMGVDDANLIYYASVVGALVWSASFAVYALPRSSVCGVEWTALAVAAGLVSFIVHDMINFAAFVPGAGFTFFILYAALLAIPSATGLDLESPGRPASRAFAGFFAVILLVFATLWTWRQVSAAGAHLSAARASIAAGRQRAAVEHFRAAANADPLDPVPLAELGEVLARIAGTSGEDGRKNAARSLTDAASAMKAAIERDPVNVSLRRGLARVLLQNASITGEAAAFRQAVEAARDILVLYPKSPPDIAEVATMELAAAETSGDPAQRAELARSAAAKFAAAIELDNSRPAWERHRRLSVKELREIERRLQRAQDLAD